MPDESSAGIPHAMQVTSPAPLSPQPRWHDGLLRRVASPLCLAALAALVVLPSQSTAASDRAAERFDSQVLPLLEEYCYTCHTSEVKKGGVALDVFETDAARLHDHELWTAVLKNLRAGIMPPLGKPRPSDKELKRLEEWVKLDAFGINPADPDPGPLTVRRLNRVEYRNTIRELIGVDFDTNAEFPPDDTGHGFDNIGDVLTISPLLLEKYLAAARTIVTQAVPMAPGAVAETKVPGSRFHPAGEKPAAKDAEGPLTLSYYEPASVACTIQAPHTGHYQLVLDLAAQEKYVDNVFDYNKCRLTIKADGEELLRKEFSRQEGRPFQYEYDREWQAGDHEVTCEIEPLTPGEKQTRSLAIRINAVILRGPLEKQFWTRPASYGRFFPKDVPQSLADRRAYARELLGRFATRAFRRPVDDETIDRLTALAESIYSSEGQTFEAGVAQAMIAILASPRFLFREEGLEAGSTDRYPLVDEYALASRLSYFLWSSMPDEELFRLAGEHRLRAQLPAQVRRMLDDKRSSELFRHFVGQWLQARDIDTVLVNAFAVIGRDRPPDPDADRRRMRFRELNRKAPESLTDSEKKELEELRTTFFRSFGRFRQYELNGELRQAMRRETEMLFEHVVRTDRSLLDLLDCNYTFLNERLAKHYGIEDVKGPEMRLVELPADSPRGGILTQGTVLAVTSNPDRTSPVKRGLFILDNILGTPPAPPPPNLPTLEDVQKTFEGRVPTLRETLEVHRKAASCSVCHKRMDPLGLALENFNALGMWRDKERNQPIDATGTLVSGESFSNIKQLKRILVKEHHREFYRCVTEKMLTYALGRGLDYRDTDTVDRLVERLEAQGGNASTLIMGIIESTPFQRRQRLSAEQPADQADVSLGSQTNAPN